MATSTRGFDRPDSRQPHGSDQFSNKFLRCCVSFAVDEARAQPGENDAT
jgi:hypothetical protein